MTDTNGGTGFVLTRELAEVRGKVELMLKEQDEDSENLRELFGRVNMLERRMAQILVFAIAVSLITPVVVEAGFRAIDLRTPHQHKNG